MPHDGHSGPVSVHIVSLLVGVAVAAWSGSATLKFQLAGNGCRNSVCDKGWYSNPAFTNQIPATGGAFAVITGASSLTAVWASNGTKIWEATSPLGQFSGRTWPDIVIAQLDGAGLPEVVAGFSSKWVGAYDLATGAPMPGFPVQLPGVGFETRALAVADLTGSGKGTIAAGLSGNTDALLYLVDSTGALLPGWSTGQPTPATISYGWAYNADTIGITNMDGDAQLEVLGPIDKLNIGVWKSSGAPVVANPALCTTNPPLVPEKPANINWGHVSLWRDATALTDCRNNCGATTTGVASRAGRTDPGFAPVLIADVDGNGVNEIVALGDTYSYCTATQTTLENGLFILNKDATRYVNGTRDWSSAPQPFQLDGSADPSGAKLGIPLDPNYPGGTVTDQVNHGPVAGDIDGDNLLEILFSSYDGKLHAFWLDKIERFNWPFVVGTPAAPAIAGPPVLVDLDNDGKAEVIFATKTGLQGVPIGCTQNTCQWGTLFILDYQANMLASVPLPMPKSCQFCVANPTNSICPCTDKSGGSLASPLIFDADGNGLLDIFINTNSAGLVRYEVSNSTGFRILVGNSKGNMQRTGEAPATVRGGPVATVASTTTSVVASTATTVAATTTSSAAAATVSSTATTGTAAVAPTVTTVASTTSSPPASTITSQSSGTRTTAVASGATSTTTAAPPTVPPSCTPSALADPPTKGGIPCLQCCFGASTTMSRFGATLNVDYDSFDCPTWLAALSTQLGGVVRVCAQRRGSFIVTLESDTAVGQRFDTWADGLAQNQQLANQPATSVTKTDGVVVAAPGSGGSNVALIVGIVVGAVLLVAIIVIVVVVVVLRRRKKSAVGYSSLMDEPLSSSPSYIPLQASYVPAATPTFAAAATVVRVRINAKIDAVDSSTLSVAAGTVANIDMADWANRGDWVWATVGASQGYVPSSFCEALQ